MRPMFDRHLSAKVTTTVQRLSRSTSRSGPGVSKKTPLDTATMKSGGAKRIEAPAAPALALLRREMGRREAGVSHSSSLERSALLSQRRPLWFRRPAGH